MEEINPYQRPQAQVSGSSRSMELAGRGERLAAKLLDSLMSSAISLPLMYFSGLLSMLLEAAKAGQTAPVSYMLAAAGIGLGIHLLLHGYPLHAYGQTWGKRLLGIRIVDLDGQKPALAKLVLLRFVPTQLLSLIPFVGKLIALVDILMVFRNDRRCLHDFIAGTRVVNVRAAVGAELARHAFQHS